jgi:hypothetical protein
VDLKNRGRSRKSRGNKIIVSHLMTESCRISDIFETIIKYHATVGNNSSDRDSFQANRTELDAVFFACCGDYPGAVAVRDSYDAYMSMILSDLQDLDKIDRKQTDAPHRDRMVQHSRPPRSLYSLESDDDEASNSRVRAANVDQFMSWAPENIPCEW